MAPCLPGRPPTPLELHARTLASADDALAMLYPMYAVRAEVLLEMTRIDAHEKLKACGDVVIFDESMGNAAFVSHQWVTRIHPDPEFEQMRVLQEVLRHLLCSKGWVSLDFVTEMFVPGAKGILHEEFQARPLFIWYDYFSVPQHAQNSDMLARAINSIPAYVASCRFFFALCPTIESPTEEKVLNAASWGKRGWCRFERAARELSALDSWVLVRGVASFQVVGTIASFVSGSVGEGEFSLEDDRWKLAPVMKSIVRNKLLLSLQAGDLPAYRRHLNLQTVHLRGLDVEPVDNLIPSDASPFDYQDLVTTFMYQNGFTHIHAKDSAGFRPVHYAALSGNWQVVEGLLARHVDPNRRTGKPEPGLGLPPLMSALDLASLYVQNDVVELLISARAHLEGGLIPSTQHAAMCNAEGLRLLCAARGDPTARNVFGVSCLETAAAYGQLAVLEELMLQAQYSPQKLGLALESAMSGVAGSAELVEHLIGLRADVDFRYDPRRDLSRLGRAMFAAQSLKHWVGRPSAASSFTYHSHGRTPLMAAMQSAQHDCAAALIAAGARLDLRNCRNWTAADFAQGQELPSFLQKGLQGDRTECRRVASLAHPDGYVEMPF